MLFRTSTSQVQFYFQDGDFLVRESQGSPGIENELESNIFFPFMTNNFDACLYILLVH